MKRLALVLGLLGALLATAFGQGNSLQAKIPFTDAQVDEGAQLGSAYPEIAQSSVSPIDEPETQPAAPRIPAELQRVRAALEKYHNPVVAVHDGYLSTLACLNFPHKSLAGHEQYPMGAMGVHFINAQLVGPVLDPMKPQILLYEPDGAGKLRLTGAEWFVPLAMAKERPKLFNQDFAGPMEGHEPIMPAEEAHYDLHVWLFKNNPEGMFAPTNPAVECAGYSYALDLDSTKMVMSAMKH
jgi:hypothetical protein